jgi:hypothetical protein
MGNHKAIAYITADSTREELYEAYIKSQHTLKRLRFNEKKHNDYVKELRREKNERYNKLKYQVMKRDQKIYGLKTYIQRLIGHNIRVRAQAKKKGILEGKSRIAVKDYSIIKMYNFLTKIDNVSKILDMKLVHCAFILWAGKYHFFTFKDFKEDNLNFQVGFHSLVSYFKKHNFIIPVSSDKVTKQYALTGTGIDMFNKIYRFTKKEFNINE